MMVDRHPAAGCRHCVRPKPLDAEGLEQLLRQALRQHGWTEASAETAHSRQQLCAGCAKYDQHGTCRVCGCLTGIRTRIQQQHCPDAGGGRW